MTIVSSKICGYGAKIRKVYEPVLPWLTRELCASHISRSHSQYFAPNNCYRSWISFRALAQWNPGQWGATQEIALLADVLLPSLNLAKASSLSLWCCSCISTSQGEEGDCGPCRTLRATSNVLGGEVHKDDGFYYQVLELWYTLKWLYSGNL